MPSTSAKQAKFMRAVAHSPKFAKKVGVPQSVGKDFEMADKKKMKKFGVGGGAKGSMVPRGGPGAGRKTPMPREPITGGRDTVPYTPERKKFLDELERRNKAARDEAISLAKKAPPYAKGGEVMKSRGVGLPDSMLPQGTASRRPQAPSQTTKPSAAKPKYVRLNEKTETVKLNPHKKGGKVMKKADKAGRALVKKSADTMGRAMKMNKGGKCYASGGLVAGHKSADGIATKGKTKGKMVAMKRGGKC